MHLLKGGLSTSLSDLISSLTLSLLVATTGILLPIGFSFLLIPFGASPLQCFSAGASLSATSLGTAFATLSSSGLLNTDVGTLLTSAAMLDDVIGLVMLQVVTELSTGQGTASNYSRTIGRALGASVGLVLVVVIICRLILRPLYKPITSWLWSPTRSRILTGALGGVYSSLVAHTAILLILVVAGSYAGTSTLLAAFIAGTVVRWWGDVVIPHEDGASNDELEDSRVNPPVRRAPQTGLQVYERFYGLSTQQILKPFFFVSSITPPRVKDFSLLHFGLLGVNWILDTDKPNVPRNNCLERTCVCITDVPGKDGYGSMACPQISSANDWPSRLIPHEEVVLEMGNRTETKTQSQANIQTHARKQCRGQTTTKRRKSR